MAYSFHLGSDKNKKGTARTATKKIEEEKIKEYEYSEIKDDND